jgi:uncharacterized membrane protein
MVRVLVAGETSVSYHVHLKGLATYGEATHAVELARFLAALAAGGAVVDHVANHVAVREFPASPESLAVYDVIVLSDIAADTLLLHPDTTVRGQRSPDRLRLIGERVAAGGGLLMIGGYMSFAGFEGKGRYAATALADVLPVEILPHDDRVEMPEGITPVVNDPGHPVLNGIPGEWPHFFGYNRLVARPGSWVGMTIGRRDPFLVTGEHGTGRVAAIASDCAPHWASPEFLGWQHYDRFWNQLIAWLAGSRA